VVRPQKSFRTFVIDLFFLKRKEKMKKERDIEKTYSTSEFVSKLRRLADSLESGKKFEIQIAGERIYVPVRAEFNIEHEREGAEEEIEFQIKWSNE
jgi:amphi-Trp domain-containing protein